MKENRNKWAKEVKERTMGGGNGQRARDKGGESGGASDRESREGNCV